MADANETYWIQLLIQGHEKAFRYLYETHYVVLCRLVNTWVHDPYLAETIVEDVIIHLYEIHEELEITTSLRSYLVRAVRNRCLNHLQQEAQHIAVSIEDAEAVSGLTALQTMHEETPLGSLLEQELEEKIEAAINHLPQETRTVFCKSRFEQKKNEEIAQELGVSVNTVKYHMKQALHKLHQELGKYLLVLLFLGH